MTHPLFRIADGQDALILAHSKAVARPKSLVAVEPLSQYERDGFDGRLGKTSAQWWMDREYRQRCAAFHAAPGKNASAPPPHTYLGYAYTTSKVTHFADFGAADCSQVSNASALQNGRPSADESVPDASTNAKPGAAVAEAPEQWHTEAPTVAGVYVACLQTQASELTDPKDQAILREHRSHWDGCNWTITCSNTARAHKAREANKLTSFQLVWLRLIEADAPQAACAGKNCGATDGRSHSAECFAEHEAACGADTRPLLKWIKGCDVPEGERIGLWFIRGTNCVLAACRTTYCYWLACSKYLRAAPGVREGDAFDANLYRSE